MENPEEEFDVNKNCPEVSEEEYEANPSLYKHVCWDLNVISCNIRLIPDSFKL